jgi:conjugative relaxase-like TrwC/TraI family protein
LLDGLRAIVLSIGKLATGQANYYLDQAQTRVDRATSVGSGLEDYYVGGTEAPGYWRGGGAARAGATGIVDGDALRHVLEGRTPMGEKELVPDHARRVPGFDVTFSAPKSVSVLFGLGDEPLRRAVRTAHDEAVQDALGYLERVAARGRRKRGGQVLMEGRGLVAAAFRHRTSRAGDPQLHTHVLIANLVEGVDGKWSALDGRGIYQHGKTAGYLYEAALRTRLSRRLGVEWGPVTNGIADIEDVPLAVLQAFSRRRAEVEAELERRGESSSAAARMATLATRRRKDYGVVPEQLIAEWRERAAELGFGRQELRGVLGRTRDRAKDPEWMATFRLLASSEGLTRRRATFARRDVIQGLCETVAPGGATALELEAAADRFLASELAVPIMQPDEGAAEASIRRRDGRLVYTRHAERRFSTVGHLALEQDIIETALSGRRAGAAVVPERLVRRAVRGRRLSAEQEGMVRRLTMDGDRVAVVLGQAGSGKTYALRAARCAWETTGTPVFGAAIALRAARELEDGAGISSTSVASLLSRLRAGAELPRGGVLVVDEAGMLPTRELDELLGHVARTEGKLVLTGDHRQLPELEAGGCFRGLVYRLPAITLVENRRQRAHWERAALRELRHGDVASALDQYRSHGRVLTAKDGDAVRTRMVADWLDAGGAPEAIMIALRRRDARALNRLARQVLVEAGHVNGPELLCAGEQFAAGDAVLLRRNDARLGIANGDRGTVADVCDDSLLVRVRGRTVRLDASYLRQTTAHGDPVLAHGYAVTGHVAQGMTVREALVLATDEMYREWAYTALSRGTDANRLYLVDGEPSIRDEIAPQARRDIDDELIASLRRSRRQSMAHDSGTPLELERLRAVEEEREAISVKLAKASEAPKGRWRRRAAGTDLTAMQRAMLEQRRAELAEEEAAIRRAYARALDAPTMDPSAQDQPERAAERSPDRTLGR